MVKVFYIIGGEIGTFILFLFYTNLFPVPPGRAGLGQEWELLAIQTIQPHFSSYPFFATMEWVLMEQ